MSKIKEMFKKQLELQQRIFWEKHKKNFEAEAVYRPMFLLEDNVYYVVEELHEMGRELPFMKTWRTYNQTPIQEIQMFEAAKKEFIDVWHFAINIALILNVDPVDFDNIECEKLNIDIKTRCWNIKNCINICSASCYNLLVAYERKLKDKSVDNRQVRYVFGQIFGALLRIADCLDMTFDEIYTLYMEKNKVNHERQDGGY
jgi:dimeric dUTPase (all-alpha-NTP-PPase superfamily)